MQRPMYVLVGLLSGVVASAARSGAASRSPVERVVDLLKDLKTRAEADGDSEEKTYNKYACWCDKAMKSKADAIDQGRMELRSLSQEILKLKGEIATLGSQIDELEGGLADNAEMVEEATSIRQKENTAYAAETDEMKQAIAAMEKATSVLVEATGSAFLQEKTSAGHLAVRNLLAALPVGAKVPAKSLSLLSEFLNAGAAGQPQSGTVQGILKDMYTTFASDLESATNAEAIANREFEGLVAEKATESKLMKESKATHEADKAEAETNLATATELFDGTGQQRAADIKFFDAAQDACLAKSDEWTERKSMRKEEVEGIEEALKILTSDEARQLFATAIKPGKETGASFLQVASVSDSEAQALLPGKAYAALRATRSKSLRMAQLAVSVRMAKVGHFDKVISEIDKMIAAIQDEGAADIEKRDHCKGEYQKITSTVKDLDWQIKKNNAKIDKLTELIATREDEKVDTIEAIQTIMGEMDDMTKQRSEENAAFKAAKQEDRSAIELITSARTALTKFYEKNKVEMGEVQGSVKLLQKEPEFAVDEFQAPDAGFSDKGSRKGESKGIVSIMSYLIEDLEDEIKNGVKMEAKSQADYEDAMKAAKQVKEDLEEKKVTLEEAIASRGQEKTAEQASKDANKADKKGQQDYKAEIKPDCDWIIGAFKERQGRREAELEGLGQAKSYLAGMSPSLLQKEAKPVDRDALANIGFLSLPSIRRA
jgi:exonuclease VII small subunit